MFTLTINSTINHFCCICFVAMIFYACDKKQNNPQDLPKPYQKLAIELSPYRYTKPSTEFDKTDSTASFRIFKFGLDDLLKKIPSEKDASPSSIANTLNLTLDIMKIVLKRYAPAYQDSLDSLIFFRILYHMKSSHNQDMELLDEATLIDFINAYTEFMPEKVAKHDKSIDSRYSLIDFLGLSFDKPIKVLDIKLENKAFAYVRANILKKKFNSTLSEKQKLLMDVNSFQLINTLSDEQAALFREFLEYSKYLE